jgi:hypothetical protein
MTLARVQRLSVAFLDPHTHSLGTRMDGGARRYFADEDEAQGFENQISRLLGDIHALKPLSFTLSRFSPHVSLRGTWVSPRHDIK